MSKYQALIDALEADGLTDCPWEACGPSFGSPRPIYLNEVIASSDDEDDSGPLKTVCRAPLGSKDECTDDMAYIAAANPSTIRALLADREMAEKDAERYQELKKRFRVMSLDMGGNHTWVLASSGWLKGPSMDEAVDALAQMAKGE